jgi:YD repeat-containing protein
LTQFDLIAGDGAVTNFRPSEGVASTLSASYSYGTTADNLPTYAPKLSTRASGQRQTFTYLVNIDNNSSIAKKIISSVSSSSGYGITLSYSSNSVNGAQTYYEGLGRITQVSDGLGRSVGYQCSTDNPGASGPIPYYLSATIFRFDCGLNVTNLVLGLSKYTYASGNGNYADSSYPDRVLKSWTTPLNGTTPYLNISYDQVLHVASYQDIGNRTTKAFTSTIGDDRFRIGELQDPLGAITSTIFDENASALRVADPNGRVTSNVYDSARRLIRTVMPEGNAVEYAYDIRGNKTRECMIPKGVVNWSSLTALNERNPQCNVARTPVADLATTTFYMEAASLRADQCVNMKTCNKPSYVVDTKGARTDYEWSGVHGQLTKETGPADINGVRPVTGYGYSAYTGVDSAVFYLLTSKVETISSGMTTTTAYEYDTANKFVLKSAVVDSGGLSLRTCYKFDPAGNLISKIEPKAGLAVCP